MNSLKLHKPSVTFCIVFAVIFSMGNVFAQDKKFSISIGGGYVPLNSLSDFFDDRILTNETGRFHISRNNFRDFVELGGPFHSSGKDIISYKKGTIGRNLNLNITLTGKTV